MLMPTVVAELPLGWDWTTHHRIILTSQHQESPKVTQVGGFEVDSIELAPAGDEESEGEGVHTK